MVESLTGDYGLTNGKQYKVLFEYDTVYEVRLDNGKIGCRNKEFFKVIK